jgi:hypothetical protein
MLSPESLTLLGKENREREGIVEYYIYSKVRGRLGGLTGILDRLSATNPKDFSLRVFLDYFENDARFRRSMDKVYELVVYSLFDTLTKHLRATVTLNVDRRQKHLIIDFERFASMVLGLDRNRLSISQPARLFRFGVTNAADTGLDLWANFGPAVQVKHITFTESAVSVAREKIMADKLVIVCKSAEKSVIERICNQLGLDDKIQGFITESDLIEWFNKCASKRYATTIGKDVLIALINEFKLEFPIAYAGNIDAFIASRNYPNLTDHPLWGNS